MAQIGKRYHCCLSIEGAIRNAKDLRGCITLDNGQVLMTVKEIRDFMKSQLALGRRVLPCGDCDNFDYQIGCKGHEVEDESNNDKH